MKKIIKIAPILVIIIIVGTVFNIIYNYVMPVTIDELSEEELKIVSNEFGIKLNSNDDFEELIAGRDRYELKLGVIKDVDELVNRLIIDKEISNKAEADIVDLQKNGFPNENSINFKKFTTLMLYKKNTQPLAEIRKSTIENSEEFFEIVKKRM